jgi:hypothetical protein
MTLTLCAVLKDHPMRSWSRPNQRFDDLLRAAHHVMLTIEVLDQQVTAASGGRTVGNHPSAGEGFEGRHHDVHAVVHVVLDTGVEMDGVEVAQLRIVLPEESDGLQRVLRKAFARDYLRLASSAVSWRARLSWSDSARRRSSCASCWRISADSPSTAQRIMLSPSTFFLGIGHSPLRLRLLRGSLSGVLVDWTLSDQPLLGL